MPFLAGIMIKETPVSLSVTSQFSCRLRWGGWVSGNTRMGRNERWETLTDLSRLPRLESQSLTYGSNVWDD